MQVEQAPAVERSPGSDPIPGTNTYPDAAALPAWIRPACWGYLLLYAGYVVATLAGVTTRGMLNEVMSVPLLLMPVLGAGHAVRTRHDERWVTPGLRLLGWAWGTSAGAVVVWMAWRAAPNAALDWAAWLMYNAYFPLTIAALWHLSELPRPGLARARVLVEGVIALTATATLAWYAVFRYDVPQSTTTVLGRAGWLLIGEMTTVFLATMLVSRPVEKAGRPWSTLLGVGLYLAVVADFAYDHSKLVGTTWSSGLGDLLLALAAVVTAEGLFAVGPRVVPALRAPHAGSAQGLSVLPYVAIGTVATLLVAAFWQQEVPSPIASLVAGGGALMALVIVRLYIAQSEATAEAVARAAQDARFRSMVHRSADAMLVMDADGTLQYATPSFAEMLGQAPETELSGPVHALPGMSSFPPALTPSGPTPFRWKLGHGAHQRDVEVLVTDLRQDPAVHGYVLNLRDVTERHRLEEQLRQSQKLEVAGRLAASVAHDFNNILMVVLGNARLAAVRPHGAHADEWAAVGAAAERGAALARQLLAIGKPTPLQPSVVDVAVCLGSMSRTLEAVLPTSVECRIEVQQVRMPVFIDPVQVEQVILNLALNARDAMPSGGRLDINASLTVEARPRLRIDVRDSGSGMSDEVRSLAFEPFFTTKADGLGTGLGLSTVRGIVTDRGGEVSLASTPGQGTTVSVFLPLTPEVEAVVDAGAFPTQAARAARLLVVDDEPAVRDVLRRLLSLHGYEVMVASDGAEALRLLGSSATGVDLVLTDLVMPRMGGESLAREIRTHYPTVAVLCMSGTPSVIAGDDVPWSSANLLTKPIDPEALVLRVSEALTARESVAATG